MRKTFAIYMFALVIIHHEKIDYNVITMIDSEIIENFSKYFEMREMLISHENKIKSKLKIFDDVFFFEKI